MHYDANKQILMKLNLKKKRNEYTTITFIIQNPKEEVIREEYESDG